MAKSGKQIMTKNEIFHKIKMSHKPVIIAGAGIVGKTILTICKENNIEVAGFCDSSIKVAGTVFCGLKVTLTPILNKVYDDAIIIISVAAIKDVVDLLESISFVNWYAGGELLKHLLLIQSNPDSSIKYDQFAIKSCIFCHNGYLNPNKLFFRSIDIIITERCTLRCKDCSNLMQYYTQPKHCDTNKLLKAIDKFCTVVDEVMEFRIIGGEAFLNKNWPLIVKRLTDEKKAKRIVLYTNGTLLPPRKYFSTLQNNKILVVISDYGKLSTKLDRLKTLFKNHNISYHILQVDEWLDCAAISPHFRTPEQNRQLFQNCCAKNMHTLSDGKLFRCPYAANAARLMAVPDDKDDYINLSHEPLTTAKNINNTKNLIKNYIADKDFLKICDYCNGRPLSGNEVKPTVQIKNPLSYTKLRQNLQNNPQKNRLREA